GMSPSGGRPLKRVLLVDDDDGVRLSLSANLELEGFDVVEAKNGEEAIALARSGDFDLVITDVRMPGINGVDTFRAIRKHKPDLAVVIMTGFALESLLDEAQSEGTYAV